MAKKKDSLALPGLRAHMGSWVYYITFMKMGDIAERIDLASDIHTSEALNELLQRNVSNRAIEIGQYLLDRDQRFFNALVVGTYGGSPQWNEVTIRGSRPHIGAVPEFESGTLGILELSGGEQFFAIDGQHRVGGIKDAVAKKAALADEEVCVIFVKGVTAKNRAADPEGFERTRRLFTTLNRYAKPVSVRDIVALDEDDAIAIVTRRLVENYDLFKNRVSTGSARNMLPTDTSNFTTIVTLYDSLDILLRDKKQGWAAFKKKRPSEDRIDELADEALTFWDGLVSAFPPLKRLKEKPAEKGPIGKRYRSEDGGHLLFRPVGLLLIVKTIKSHMEEGQSLAESIKKVAKVPMELTKDPWTGLLWDPTNHRMLASRENQRAAERLLFAATGGDLSRLKSSEDKLKRELGGLLNQAPATVKLPSY